MRFPRLILLAFVAAPAFFVVTALVLLLVFGLSSYKLPAAWNGLSELGLFADFYAYWSAAKAALRSDPYDWGWYLGTPVFARLLVPLAFFPMHAAAVTFQGVWLAGFVAVARIELRRVQERAWLLAAFLLFLATSQSFLWALARANVDPLAMTLLAAALVFAATGREYALGVCVAFATFVKYYAMLLVLPLEALGFRRAANVIYGVLAAAFFLMGPTNWLRPFAKKQMTERLGYLMPEGNLSISHLWWTVAHTLGLDRFREANTAYFVLSAVVLVVAFVAALVCDARRNRSVAPSLLLDRSAELALYLPFFVAFPRQVYPYQGLLTLPVFLAVARLAETAETIAQKRALLLVAVGVGLQHSHAIAVARLLGGLGLPGSALNAVSSLGTLLAIVGAAACKVAATRAEKTA